MGYHVASSSALFGRGSQLSSGEVAASGGYMEGSSDQLFGAGSQLGSGSLVESATVLSDATTPLLIGGWLSQLLVMLTFIVAMPPLFYVFIGLWRANTPLTVCGCMFLAVHFVHVLGNLRMAA